MVLLSLCVPVAWSQTTAFAYQGKLTDAGNPANGDYEMQFKLFDLLAGGSQVGGTLLRDPVTATAGMFTVTLDFGVNVFTGADRFLEIGVRPNNSPNAYTVLAPRQPILPAPYAIQTINATNASNAAQLGGLPASRYLASTASGNFGIGTASPIHNLQINGTTSLGGPGGVYGFLVPGAPPGPYSTLTFNSYGISNTAGVAGYGGALQFQDGAGTFTFYTSNASIAAGASHTFAPRITLLSGGNVGIGTTTPQSGRLHVDGGTANAVYGASSSGVGVFGSSSGFEGVRGEASNIAHGAVVGSHNAGGIAVFGSSSGVGVQGTSTGSNRGVIGTSAAGTGVYGSSVATGTNFAGVHGFNSSPAGTGVIGEASSSGAIGMFGVSNNFTGYGMYARNLAGGYANFADGHAGQWVYGGGFVKALVRYDPGGGGIVACYNSQGGQQPLVVPPCGFTSTLVQAGIVRINFFFPAALRFVTVTPEYASAVNAETNNVGANFRAFSQTEIEVFTFQSGSADTLSAKFTLAVF